MPCEAKLNIIKERLFYGVPHLFGGFQITKDFIHAMIYISDSKCKNSLYCLVL